jgi:His-Xaa-Ser system protein HxsD
MPEVLLRFQLSIYRLAAVKKAAYRFGGRCFIHLTPCGADEVEVRLVPKTQDADIGTLAGDCTNEVLDQELRELIAEETSAVRNLLLAQAFSATSLVDPVGETADYRTDPNGIARPDRS